MGKYVIFTLLAILLVENYIPFSLQMWAGNINDPRARLMRTWGTYRDDPIVHFSPEQKIQLSNYVYTIAFNRNNSRPFSNDEKVRLYRRMERSYPALTLPNLEVLFYRGIQECYERTLCRRVPFPINHSANEMIINYFRPRMHEQPWQQWLTARAQQRGTAARTTPGTSRTPPEQFPPAGQFPPAEQFQIPDHVWQELLEEIKEGCSHN